MIARFMTLGVAALFALALTSISPAVAATSSDTAVTAQHFDSVQVAAAHGGKDGDMKKKIDADVKKMKKKGKKKKKSKKKKAE